MEIIKHPSPNVLAKGRRGRKIIAIVNHITDGAFPGCLDWLCNPVAEASSNYLITRAGQIYELVSDEDAAEHAGVVDHCTWPLYDGHNPNLYTIGIEHEGHPNEPLTEPQYQATLWLHRQLIAKHAIPVDPVHITKHSNINAKHNCPGPAFPWARLFADLKSVPQATQQSVNIQIGATVIPGTIIDGHTYGQVSVIAQAIGRQVSWDGTKNVVMIPPVTVPVPAGAPGTVRVATGGTIIPGKMIESHAYALVTDLAKALGHVAVWDAPTRTVVVK